MSLKLRQGGGNSLGQQRVAAEELLVRRNPSPEIHKFSPYILLLLAVPMFIAGQRYLQTKCTRATVSIDFRRALADRNPIKVFRG